ncbi:MAG: hypothetical protein M3457_02695 [Chloroflexota bacterium]|nr:hypothetical protein [Chloroflexota bacterium]
MAALRLGTDVPRRPSPAICIGVDIGQKVDPTTIVVTEAIKVERPGRKPDYRFEVRHMERLPIGTPYPDVGTRIAEVVANLEARPVPPIMSLPRLHMVVDATGVGRPVVDILRDALHGSRVKVKAATFTHGDRMTGTWYSSNTEWVVGKAFLVSRLQSLFQTQRIKLPANHSEAQAMAQELNDYELKVSEQGNDTYGAFRVGAHDDLVTALGLAVLMDPPGPQIWGT